MRFIMAARGDYCNGTDADRARWLPASLTSSTHEEVTLPKPCYAPIVFVGPAPHGIVPDTELT